MNQSEQNYNSLPRVPVVSVQCQRHRPPQLTFLFLESRPEFAKAQAVCHAILYIASGFKIRQQRHPGRPVWARVARRSRLIAQPPGVIARGPDD